MEEEILSQRTHCGYREQYGASVSATLQSGCRQLPRFVRGVQARYGTFLAIAGEPKGEAGDSCTGVGQRQVNLAEADGNLEPEQAGPAPGLLPIEAVPSQFPPARHWARCGGEGSQPLSFSRLHNQELSLALRLLLMPDGH